MTELEESVMRFFAHIANFNSIDECWMWKTLKDSGTYGTFIGAGIKTTAHRWIWMYLNGIISNKEVVHHKCHNKRCVNPTHLECLSTSSHIMRHVYSGDTKYFNAELTHCKRGHEFTEENTRRQGTRRKCRACIESYKMARESYYFYLTDREMQLCMAALAMQLTQLPDVEWQLRNEISTIVNRMAEEIAK